MLMTNLFEEKFKESSIFADRNVISQHYLPEKILFRKKQIDEIVDLLSATINKQKAGNIFVYGKTGVGKTSTVKNVLMQLQEFAEKKQSVVFSTYMNCRNYNSKYKVVSKIVKDFYPEKEFIGYSASFVYEKMQEFIQEKKMQAVIVLDEIDKVKDLDELIYALTRANDELKEGSINLIGISNKLTFKERLDPRTKSSLCEQEILFPPYNAKELKAILEQRVEKAFIKDIVSESAVSLAAAFAAQESGDARTAVMLLQRAGEIAEKEGLTKVSDEEVKKARIKVEEEIIYDMISTLPEQEQFVLHAIARLSLEKKATPKITGTHEQGVLFSGEIYEEYCRIAKETQKQAVSSRWYREYLNELEMYGLIVSTASGKGFRGHTQLIKLGFDAKKIKKTIEKEMEAEKEEENK